MCIDVQHCVFTPGSPLCSLRSLGTLGQGVSCKLLQESFQANPSRPAVRRILSLLRQQPGPLHTSLVETSTISVLYWPPAGDEHVSSHLSSFSWTENVRDR